MTSRRAIVERSEIREAIACALVNEETIALAEQLIAAARALKAQQREFHRAYVKFAFALRNLEKLVGSDDA